jgi:hypothetical protein
MPDISTISELYTANPIPFGATICSLMVIAAMASWMKWHPHHHDAKHRPSRAHR